MLLQWGSGSAGGTIVAQTAKPPFSLNIRPFCSTGRTTAYPVVSGRVGASDGGAADDEQHW